MGDRVAPSERRAVEIFQGGEGPGGEEAGTDILDGALHAPFFIAPSGAAREGGEVTVGGEFQEAGVEMNGIAATFQDHAAEMVGRQAPGRSTPVVKGVNVAEEKILQALVEEEFQPQGTAVREGEEEAGQTAAGAAHADFAEVRPVRLCLLTGENAQTQKGFPAWRSQVSDHPAELADTARVATRRNHLQEAGGPQARILLQGLAQEVEVRIGQLSAQSGLAAEAAGLQCPAHGIGMEKEFGGNGADLPMLGVKQMADASHLFIGNHAAPRKKDSPSAPGDRKSDRRPSRGRPLRGVKSEDGTPEWPPPALARGAPSDSHREKPAGKIDLSRELLSAGDIRVGAGDGRDALPGRDFVHSGGWPRGAAGGGTFHDSAGCNTADLDHREGRGKTPPGREKSGTPADERLWNKPPAPALRGSTGQPAPIMAG